jgi:hypothetical protein
MGQKPALSLDNAQDRLLSAAESDKERIARRPHHEPAGLAKGLAEDVVVSLKDALVGAAEVAYETRRALDIGEDECHGPCRHGAGTSTLPLLWHWPGPLARNHRVAVPRMMRSRAAAGASRITGSDTTLTRAGPGYCAVCHVRHDAAGGAGGVERLEGWAYWRTTKTSRLVRRPAWSFCTRIVWAPLDAHVLRAMI